MGQLGTEVPWGIGSFWEAQESTIHGNSTIFKHLFQNGYKPGVVQFVHLGCQIAGFPSFAVVFWLNSGENNWIG